MYSIVTEDNIHTAYRAYIRYIPYQIGFFFTIAI